MQIIEKKSSVALYLISLLRNIIFQGILYMSTGEKMYKISFTLFFAFLINLFLHNLILSLILGHIINYIVNGQYFVVFRYFSSKTAITKVDLYEYVNLIEKYIRVFKPLDVLIIGSLSRGRISRTSDLDIRLYHDGHFISSLRAYIMATVLRFYGLIFKFPIDIYCFSDMRFLDKIREDEIPVNFLENSEVLQKYPTSVNYKIQLKNLNIDL
jgi:hypothetical protein